MTSDLSVDRPSESLFEAPPMRQQERMVEVILFASAEPITVKQLNDRMPHGSDSAETAKDEINFFFSGLEVLQF